MSGELHIRRTFGEHSALFGGGLDERPFLAQKGVIFCAFFKKNKSEPDTHPVRSSPLALADGPYALPPLR